MFAPAGKSTRGAKELVVMAPAVLVFRNTDRTCFCQEPTATSGLPSPSRSPTASQSPPPGKSTLAAKEFVVRLPGRLVLRKTEVVSLAPLEFAITRSSL